MIKLLSQLPDLRKENPDKIIVYFDGVFDLLHIGHMQALAVAKSYGDILVVGVMSDVWVKKTKGDDRPIFNQNERTALIDNQKLVDHTITLYQEKRLKSSQVLLELKPDVYVTSDPSWEFRFKKLTHTETKLKVVNRKPPKISTTITPISTTDIIQYIKNKL